MNDRERFTKQMNQTFEILQRAIQKIDVPAAQKDKLSGLARNLREHAYQAGRYEYRQSEAGEGNKRGHLREEAEKG